LSRIDEILAKQKALADALELAKQEFTVRYTNFDYSMLDGLSSIQPN